MILADPLKHANLIEDMKRLAEEEDGHVEYTAGGAGLNSLRCAQVIIIMNNNLVISRSIGS